MVPLPSRKPYRPNQRIWRELRKAQEQTTQSGGNWKSTYSMAEAEDFTINQSFFYGFRDFNGESFGSSPPAPSTPFIQRQMYSPFSSPHTQQRERKPGPEEYMEWERIVRQLDEEESRSQLQQRDLQQDLPSLQNFPLQPDMEWQREMQAQKNPQTSSFHQNMLQELISSPLQPQDAQSEQVSSPILPYQARQEPYSSPILPSQARTELRSSPPIPNHVRREIQSSPTLPQNSSQHEASRYSYPQQQGQPQQLKGSQRPQANPISVKNSCAKCHSTGNVAMRVCATCKGIRYCSRECQKVDWKEHKKVCKGADRPSSSGAAVLFENRVAGLARQGESSSQDENMRRSAQVLMILNNVKAASAVAKPQKIVTLRQPPTPVFGNTVLGKVALVSGKLGPRQAHRHDLAANAQTFHKTVAAGIPDAQDCTFCTYACDWGVNDDSFFHPSQIAEGWCENCDPKSNEFYKIWTIMMVTDGHNHNGLGEERIIDLQYLDDAGDHQNAAPKPKSWTDGKPKAQSKIDGKDTTHLQGIRFCKMSPWRQIDVKKVKICEPCKEEKFAIMRHRHASFVTTASIRISIASAKSKRCMVCTGYVVYACQGCPLRLCEGCHTILTTMCKHYLDNLFYYYDREHLRNDAFLLRSDGGGLEQQPASETQIVNTA